MYSFTHLILATSLCSWFYHFHFTDETMNTQMVDISYPRSHTPSEWLACESCSLAPEPGFLTALPCYVLNVVTT